ncbi:MAG TPA: hypothetical protein VMJ66_04140 [Geobacteraceae bacterium]|nr:hypothetical protein [Geobacteraceae bacterium]
MAIITKKIGKNEYSYLVTRVGSRVVHSYLGSARSEKTLKIAATREDAAAVPERLRSLFWDTSLENISVKKHARYVIEKVLEFGDLDAYNWLTDVYPGWRIKETLLLSRNLSARSRGFWLIWYGVNNV